MKDQSQTDNLFVFLWRIWSDSMLNGLGRMLLRGVSLPVSSPSTLSRRCIEQSSGSSPDSAPPTTSIGSSSSLSLSSSSSSESLPELLRCCVRYSARSASRSTAMPFARSFRACRSSAFAIFFRRRALREGEAERRTTDALMAHPNCVGEGGERRSLVGQSPKGWK
uniref:Uncharacterized protein n=1 Tax=Anopheles atroparvus TaxID=41427 RepID=A0A182ISE6_ANOAO